MSTSVGTLALLLALKRIFLQFLVAFQHPLRLPTPPCSPTLQTRCIPALCMLPRHGFPTLHSYLRFPRFQHAHSPAVAIIIIVVVLTIVASGLQYINLFS